jgi:hypothetical protein
MGRGRAKAKQAKVARQLKYSGAGTDLDALRKELVGGSALPADAEFDELDDEYDELDDDDDETDDEDDDFGGYGATSR